MAKIHVTYPVVWADIEQPGIAPAPENGWNHVYTSPCSGTVKVTSIPAAVDRAEFNGFANYITAHSKYKVGVYSSNPTWKSIFGTGTAAAIPNTYEWTYQPETASLSAKPSGWCLSGGSGPCAQFFGGQTSASKYALMWQWSGGGGVRNPYGDYDQIDVARMDNCAPIAGAGVVGSGTRCRWRASHRPPVPATGAAFDPTGTGNGCYAGTPPASSRSS